MFLYLFEFVSVALLMIRGKRTHCYGSGHLTENGYYRSDVESAATQMIIMTSEPFVTHSGGWNDYSIDLMTGYDPVRAV